MEQAACRCYGGVRVLRQLIQENKDWMTGARMWNKHRITSTTHCKLQLTTDGIMRCFLLACERDYSKTKKACVGPG